MTSRKQGKRAPQTVKPQIDLRHGELKDKLATARFAMARIAGALESVPADGYATKAVSRHERWQSCMLEDVQCSLREIVQCEQEEGRAQAGAEIRELLAHSEIMEQVMSGKAFRLSRIAQHLKAFRENEGADRKVIDALESVDRFLRSGSGDVLVDAAVLLYQVEIIRPFPSHNGFLARLLVDLFLCDKNMLPRGCTVCMSSVFNKKKHTYGEKLDQARLSGEIEPWVSFFLDALICSADTVTSMLRESMVWYENCQYKLFVERRPRSALEAGLLRHFFKEPYLSTAQIAKKCRTSFQTAHVIVKDLEREHVLEEVSGKKKGHRYLFVPVLKTWNPNSANQQE